MQLTKKRMQPLDKEQLVRGRTQLQRGFSLIELMIVVIIIAILSAIVYPAYTDYVTTTNRAAAQGCLSEYAAYMERFYTTNMSYLDADGNQPDLTTITMQCASQTNQSYNYSFKANSVKQSAYVLKAVPKGAQASRDTKCATLTLDQTGVKGESGSGTVEECW